MPVSQPRTRPKFSHIRANLDISRYVTAAQATLEPTGSGSLAASGDAGVVRQHIGRQALGMSDVLERFRVRVEGTRPIRLTVAEMTPNEALAAVEFLERELQLTQAAAAPALALLQRATDGDGDQSAPQWELRRAREMVATLVRVQQQTDRLLASVRVVQLPAPAD